MISTLPRASSAFRSAPRRTSDLGKPRRRSRLPTVGIPASHAAIASGSSSEGDGAAARPAYSGTSSTMRATSSRRRAQCSRV